MYLCIQVRVELGPVCISDFQPDRIVKPITRVMAPELEVLTGSTKALTLQAKTREQLQQDVLHHLRAILDSKRQINTLVPIGRLPSEVLVEIFIHCRNLAIAANSAMGAASRHDRTIRPLPPYAWLKITHVCHRWRQAALDFPRLWSVVVLSGRVECAHELLSRAKMAPLTVCSAPPKTPPTPIIERVLRDREHLVTVDICTRGGNFPGLTADPAPNLENLALQYTDSRYSLASNARHALLDHFVSCDLPCLRTLSLQGGLRVWPAPLLKPTLTHLRLCCREMTPGRLPISTSSLMDALAAMPLLQELDLGNVFAPMTDEDWSDDDVHPTVLPKLHRLNLVEDTLRCADLLRRLSFPPTAVLSLACLDRLPVVSHFCRLQAALRLRLMEGFGNDGNAQPLRSLLFSQSDWSSWTKIYGWTDHHPVNDICHYHGASKDSDIPEPNVSITTSNTGGVRSDDAVLLHWLLDSIDASKIESLHLSLTLRRDSGKDAVLALFEELPALRELSVDSWAEEYIRDILAPRHIEEGSHRVGRRKRAELCMPVPKLALFRLEHMILGAPATSPQTNTPLASLRAALTERKKERVQLSTLVIRKATNFFADDAEAMEELVERLDWDGFERGEDEDVTTEDDDSGETFDMYKESYDDCDVIVAHG